MLHEKSCGAIVYRRFHGNIEILLIKHVNSGHWSFPKGHVEGDETELETARKTLAERGCAAPVSVSLSEEDYPTRDYGDFSLPAGRYLSLRVVIGEGKGKNWWCVLFPPLCTAASVDGVPLGLSDAEYRLVTEGKKSVRFKTLELFSRYFPR